MLHLFLFHERRTGNVVKQTPPYLVALSTVKYQRTVLFIKEAKPYIKEFELLQSAY